VTVGDAAAAWPLATQRPVTPMRTLSIVTERRGADSRTTERSNPQSIGDTGLYRTGNTLHPSTSSRIPEMNRLLTLALLPLLARATAIPASAADVTPAELMRAATVLAQQYDANYAAKNPAGVAALYAPDGVLVAPSGSIVRGRQALTTYYAKRFASGARGHAIKVVEAHVQGNGGYGLSQFTVTVPGANGNLREEHGSIAAVYRRDADGWHLRLVEPSVPNSADQ
jgi:uncharacterized protein (TIGR02246 family)